MKNSGINSRMHRDIDRVCDNIRKIPYHLIDLRGSYDHIDPSVVDESLRRFDYIYPACGSSNSAVKLSCEDLENAVDSYEWVDVCKIAE